MKVTLRFRDRPSLIIMRGEQPNNSNSTSIPMPSRSSQREGRPTLRSERTPKPEEPETNRGLINISKFNSMTKLLTHTVAHSTMPSFRPKTNNKLTKKFLSLTVT